MRIGLLKAHEQNLILLYPALASARNPPVSIGTLPSAEIRYSCENPVVVQFPCHPEQAFFAQRRIWASRATRRVSCGAIIARLARFLTKLHHYRKSRILLVSSVSDNLILWLTMLQAASLSFSASHSCTYSGAPPISASTSPLSTSRPR